jgi:hypothetical protein
MRLSLRAAVVAAAILWGGAILLVSLINFADPRYGVNFLQMTNSVYPWFHGTHTVSSVVGRTLEGAVDGAIGAVIFAWLYNRLASPRKSTPASQQ